ncbi:hypothetical protein [Enterovirga rhinocerotis]|uniref:hypothetical protein n=1 Tax=Enterovirga rhinocerotis TaxID=1339210 RepID=UPI001414DCC9|nr:hypothetical protein [Enterovirga rhinocerotis]
MQAQHPLRRSRRRNPPHPRTSSRRSSTGITTTTAETSTAIVTAMATGIISGVGTTIIILAGIGTMAGATITTTVRALRASTSTDAERVVAGEPG